jgi:hypothetical protein
LKAIFEFCFGVESIEGTYLEKRLKKVLDMGSSATMAYKPRKAGMNKNLDLYSPELLA